MPNKTKKNTTICGVFFFYGGQGWIRTTEDEVDGFTVRCIWPLCNLPIKFKHPLRCFFGAGERNRTFNLLITSQLLYHWATPAFYDTRLWLHFYSFSFLCQDSASTFYKQNGPHFDKPTAFQKIWMVRFAL